MYGSVRLVPDAPIVAGSYGTWRLAYTVGRYGIDNGGRLRIAMRMASDFGRPQTAEPSADNYVTATTSGHAKLRVNYDPHGGLRPFFQTTTINVFDGYLREGDQVTITYGDPSGGSRGARAQTFCEERFEFRFLVESFQTGVFVRLDSSPIVRIIAGPPAGLVATAPSLVRASDPFTLHVRAEDHWGNLASEWEGHPEIAGIAGLEMPERMPPASRGVLRLEALRLARPGTYRLEVREPALGFVARSNPVRVVDDAPAHFIYWADIHGQTDRTIGTGSVEEYFTFARDAAALDVAGHQGNDFQLDSYDWEEIQSEVKRFHEPGRFITFLGYEWSGNTPAGGDRNVYYPLADTETIYRSSHWQVADRADASNDRYPITELYREFAGRRDVLIIPHVGGRASDLAYHDPDLEPVIEICSTHGRFEWLLDDALRRGYKVGVVGNSDDHTGRPGAAPPTGHTFGVRGGLTGVYAPALTRADIFAAYKARRTYATTGERIYLSVAADGHPMGSEFETRQPPKIHVEVSGTGPLEAAELRRGREVIYAHRLDGDRDANLVRLTWGGARLTGRGRHTTWDGSFTVDGGRVVHAEGFAFDNPHEGIVDRDDHRVEWRSATVGDHDGILVRIQGGRDALLTFRSPLMTFSFSLGDLSRNPIRHDLGGVGQFVRAELAAATHGPDDITFAYTDDGIQDGLNAYYVRVVQVDGEMAWSSPIYVHYRGGSGAPGGT